MRKNSCVGQELNNATTELQCIHLHNDVNFMHFLRFFYKNSRAVIGGLFKEDKRENLLRLLIGTKVRKS